MVVVFLCRCFSGGVVLFLYWCFWGGVLWWCFCGGVLVVVFVWWCFCGGVFVVVFLWWCFCRGVSVVVFLCRCFCGVVAVVWWRWCSSGGVFVVVFLWWCTKYCSSTTEYYSVLQSTTPYSKVLLQYYSNITLYYKVLLQYYSVLQSTTPTSETMSERRPSSTTPYYASTNYKSFQNEHFVRGFRNFSMNKLPKRAFRAMLPPIFTERGSKTSVSRDASDNFHRKSFQKDRFVRGFLQISQKKLPKRAFRARLPSNFTEPCFQNERFARSFRQFCKKNLPKWSFRARLLPNFTEQASKTSVSRDASDNFHEKFAFRYSFAQSTHRFLREGSSAKSKMCLALQRRAFPNFTMYVSLQRRAQKCMNLSTVNRPASRTQKCEVLLQFWAIDTTFLPRGFTASKWNLRFATVLGDRHHVFTERVDREKMKSAFRYSFGRSTPRFYREGWPRENEICVSLQFWAIDTTFFVRGLIGRKWTLRFATVLGDRRRVFSERVAFRLTLPIPPGGIE